MSSAGHIPRWKTILAFAILYFVWGSTYLAIRVSVREIPPLLMGAIRFLVAGPALYGWMLARGHRHPTARQWSSIFLLAFLIFVCDYGVLFWAEQHVPSGAAAVMMATIPAFMALAEIVLLGTQKLTFSLGIALLIGLCGVAVLVSRSLNLGGEPIDPRGAAALIFASLSWSIASALARKLPLPSSRTLTSGAEILAGGVLLSVAAVASGELHSFHPLHLSRSVWFAWIYLTVAGSMIGFTAYVWLIHHHSPTHVGTYAYVNPVVAVLLGYFLGGEPLGLRTALGAACVLASVVLITTAHLRKPPIVPGEEPA